MIIVRLKLKALMKITGSLGVLLKEFRTKVNEKSGFVHQGTAGCGRIVSERSKRHTVSLCALSLLVSRVIQRNNRRNPKTMLARCLRK